MVQACIFKKLELDIKSDEGPTIAGAERKILVFLSPIFLENGFLKARKVLYIKPLTFTSFLHKFPTMKILIFFSPEKPEF